MMLSRKLKRNVLAGFGILLFTGLSVMLWGFVIEPNRVVVNEVEIGLPGLPAAFNRLKVVAVSDLHCGSRFINEAKLDKVVGMINQTQPDVIVLLGDFISADNQDRILMEPEVIGTKLKGLKAQFGVYAVLGNHDWGYDGKRIRSALESAGIRVLENDVAQIQKDGQTLWLLGVPDFWTRQPINISPALQKINTPGPVIALTHNPDVFPLLPANIGLTLAGHTHGGQVNIPFLGRRMVPSQYGQRYAIGHIQENNRHLFVTPGIGTSLIAVRFRVPPEISVLTLNSQ